jgi:stage II sporulation protein D
MNNIYNYDYDELTTLLEGYNEKSYRCKQIWQWLYQKKVQSFDEMTNLSKDLISKLKNDLSFDYIKIKTKQESDLTKKYLFELTDGNYIEAVYHSTSNGRTEDSSNVWGNSYPYLVSVDSLYDNTNPSFSISKSFSYSYLSSKLGIGVNSSSEFNILGYTSGGRVSSISIDGNQFSGVSFRSMLGLRSADFDIVKNDDGVVITTRGYGHGVGMSQYGANGMGKAGYSYQDILLHYYPGVSLGQL